MKFTIEQFDYLTQNGYPHLDDLPFDSSDRNLMFKLFNHLPEDIQGDVIKWGFNIFKFLLKNQFDWSVNEYYDYHYEDFTENVNIDFEKLKKV